MPAEVPFYPLWPRGLSLEKPGQEGAFEGVRRGAGEQAEPGVKSLAVTWGKSPKLASHTRNGKTAGLVV